MSKPVEMPPSLWASVTKPRKAAAPLEGEASCDVLVIGGGFTGLSTPLAPAERGRKVILLEAAQAGWGASGRNNGQVIPTMTGAEPDMMATRFGESGERFAQLVSDSAGALFDLVRRLDLKCEAEQTGWIQPAHSPGRVRLSAARVETWARRGAPVSLLDADETARITGSRFWHGAMLNRSGGHINPLAFSRELARVADAAGARIYENSPALTLRRPDRRWLATTPTGAVRADQVMLATNAYTDWFAPRLRPLMARALLPILSWQMATVPQSDAVRARALPGRQALSDTHGDLHFFRWDARGRLVTGGALVSPRNGAARLRRRIGKRLASIYPEMGEPQFEFVWNGRIGVTHDRTPRFYRLADGLWAWAGCNGRGVALATALGGVFADAIEGVPAADLPVPISPLRPYPLHALARRVAPFMLHWYRYKDAREPS